MVRLWVVLAVVAGLSALAGCGEGRRDRSGAPQASQPTPTPAVPVITLAPIDGADQGLPFTIGGRATRPGGAPVRLTADFGDGTGTTPVDAEADGYFVVRHTYARPGDYPLTIAATTDAGARATARARVDVWPRHILFVQGLNSESRCPEGRRFLDRAPTWIGEYLAGGSIDEVIAIDRSAFVYFSYSGRYCESGPDPLTPDYDREETCAGIARTYAARFRETVEQFGPGKTTVVAHSMGGLLTAYVVAQDPAWAKAHIVSVAAFDSPLGGIDFVRGGILGALGVFGDGCGRGSASIDDLRAGSRVVETARLAAAIVPFYTLDGTGDEGRALDIGEAVPSDRTSLNGENLHRTTDEEHSAIWTRPPADRGALKARFVACAILAAGEACLPK